MQPTYTFARMASRTLAVAFLAPLFVLSSTALAQDAPSLTAPDSLLTLLREGNKRFVDGRLTNENTNIPGERKTLAAVQHPFSAIVSCSDSRVPPEEVFDQGLGKLFVVRNAGNVSTEEGVASLEYAVDHLKTRLIVVLGHSSCGAVKATLEDPEGQSLGTPALDYLVAKIRPNLRDVKLPSALDHSVKENVRATCRDLKSSSKLLADAMAHGSIMIVGAFYHLDTGEVEFLNDQTLVSNSR